MSIKYPVEGVTANRLYQINQEGKAGFFPVGIHNFWHGGVNLTLGDDDLSVRAIAKGEIIAYRFTQEYCELNETYPDGSDNKKYYEKDYSHNFVLIKHKHEPENSPALEYYSLYMHLAPFKIYDAKYDKNKVSIFKRWKCFINIQKDGNGSNLRDRAGNIIGVIPQGAVVIPSTDPDSSEGYINNTKATNYIYVTSAFGDGYISEKVCLEKISSDPDQYRCKVNGAQCATDKKGLNVHETSSLASAVVAVLPKDTEFYFEEPYRFISKEGQIGSGMAKIKTSVNGSSIGYILVNSANIRKGEKVIDPVLSDSVQSCDVDVYPGEILGWPGCDGMADKNSIHFEIFAKNNALFGSNGFWTITADQGKPDSVYKIPKDTPMSLMKPNRPIVGKTIAKNTILELMDGVDSYGTFPKANARKVKIVQSESKEGWFLHSELAWQGNTKNYYHVRGDAINWMWQTQPTTSAALTVSTRDEFVGLGKTFAGNYLEFTLLEKGTVGTTNLRKVSFTTSNPNQIFQGWVKDESKLVGGSYTKSGARKKRYYAKEELKELYNKNPEFAEFSPSSTSTKRDAYVNKKDCLTAKDINGDNWIGFPKAFLESGEPYFDKDEFDKVDQWLWLKDDHGGLQTVNPFDWKEFFEKCKETDVVLGEDGFCDASRIYELVDMNYSGEFDTSEYAGVVANDRIKHQLRQIIVEHPSEWWLPSEDAMNDKWGTRLQAPPFDPGKPQVSGIQDTWMKQSRRPPRFGFNFTPEKYNAFKEVVTKTCFLDQVNGFTEDEKLWHFHPIAFVQHLKRIFDKIITFEELKQIAIYATDENINKYLDAFNEAFEKFNITTPLRIAHFLAQIIHESASFRLTREGGDETTVPNSEYGGFPGRGLIQLTRKSNYEAYEKYIGEDVTSSLVNKKKLESSPHAVSSAVWFWAVHRKLNDYADQNDFLWLTFLVNGGYNGFKDRLQWFNKGCDVLGASKNYKSFSSSKVYNNWKASLAWGLWHDSGSNTYRSSHADASDANTKAGYNRFLSLISSEGVSFPIGRQMFYGHRDPKSYVEGRISSLS